jgi:hypothetical protein
MQNKKLSKIVVIFVIIGIAGVSMFYMMKDTELFATSSIKNDDEKTTSISLKSLSLALNDLPEGYELYWDNTISDDEEVVYFAKFNYNGSEQEEYANISIWLYKPHKEEFMIERVNSLEETFDIYYEMYNHIYEEIPRKIGEESYIVTTDTTHSTKESIVPGISTFIALNIGEVTCHISWMQSENFDYLFDLAKIVEQKIYDNLK